MNITFRLTIVMVLTTMFLEVAVAQAQNASHQIRVLPTRFDSFTDEVSVTGYTRSITSVVGRYFRPDEFREVRAQLLRNENGQPDHIMVYLFREGYHRVRNAAIYVDESLNVRGVQMDYHLTKRDVEQQPGRPNLAVSCPAPDTQFIAFAPNDNDLEQQVTVQVGNAAVAKGLKTVMLLKEKATRQNYLDYMSCPNLIGNFYDGDADPNEIVTNDGVISSDEISHLLIGAFRNRVTNIWLACEAANDPMLSAMVKTSQSQKYYAGVNDLQVGPSDKAAACTMVAAIGGASISESFASCYKQFDDPSDKWGGGGSGSDFLGGTP
jgi:hypothetical protein